VLVLLAPVVVAEGVSLPIAVGTLLILCGTIGAYVLGDRWERRWEQLLREKSGPASRDDAA